MNDDDMNFGDYEIGNDGTLEESEDGEGFRALRLRIAGPHRAELTCQQCGRTHSFADPVAEGAVLVACLECGDDDKACFEVPVQRTVDIDWRWSGEVDG